LKYLVIFWVFYTGGCPGTHGALSSKGKMVKAKKWHSFIYILGTKLNPLSAQNSNQARATAAESLFLRSSLARGIETVVMERVSKKIY
jgi:hypothetical protein